MCECTLHRYEHPAWESLPLTANQFIIKQLWNLEKRNKLQSQRRNKIFFLFFAQDFCVINYLATLTQILFTQIATSCIYMGVIRKTTAGASVAVMRWQKDTYWILVYWGEFRIHSALNSLSVWLIFSFGLFGRVSCFCNSSGTLDINGASIKGRTL